MATRTRPKETQPAPETPVDEAQPKPARAPSPAPAPLPEDLATALRGQGVTVDDVAHWREEGYTTIVITADGAKHRLLNARHAARVAADQAKAERAGPAPAAQT